ncbi:MAG: histidine--tRNA ligase [Actinomycetota bacterium]|nr:histidine--tRNA ligase [Actinomycetota bacterium]
MPEEEGSFSAPKGTNDILPPASRAWQAVVRLALDTFRDAGYELIETPVFEHTEVFERGVGVSSEVVTKQMYTFTDLAGRSLTLRPEGTAPVVRAVLEHGLDKGPLPVKLAYASAMFRQERPQRGRYRQFFQVGIEAIGSDRPVVDAEVIEIGRRFLSTAGVATTLHLNSIGHLSDDCRSGYLRTLQDFLETHRNAVAPEDRERISVNPLRMFDSKEPATIAVMADAPLITNHLCPACRAHFDEVRDALTDVQVDYEVTPRLVRGLDYYTRTAFEFVAAGLGAQNAVGGGGRYDGLSESLGGPPLPGIGFALGVDRILLARPDGADRGRTLDVYVVAVGEGGERDAFKLVTRLRGAGFAVDADLAARSMKGQMKQADRSGARWAAILGERERVAGTVILKDLASAEQKEVDLASVEEALRA